MADYTPPTENLPIFDKLLFSSGEDYITQNDADKRYLRYPNAQGKENLQDILVGGVADFANDVNIDGEVTIENTLNANGINNYNGAIYCAASANFNGQVNVNSTSTFTGASTFNNDLNIIDATLANQNKICLNLQSSGVPLSQLRVSLNPAAGFLNPIVRSGDIALCYGTTNPNATALAIAPVGATSCGLRMSREGVGIGSGGTGVEQNNRIILTPAAFSLIANGTQNQVDISNNVVLNNGTGSNRQLTTSYINLNDITTNTFSGRMYGLGTNIAMDNNMVMINPSASNRQISSTYYNYTDIANNSPIALSYVSGGGVMFFDNNFNNGQFGFTVNDGGGTQRTPLIMSANAFTIASVNPPTSSATIPANDNTTNLATTAWTQSYVSPLISGKTQTISISTSQTIVVPTGVIGIGIRMIAKGGIPGLNADTGTNYSSGGTGGGGSSLVSNGMVPIIGGSTIYSSFVALSVTLRYFSTIFCTCPTGNNGGNASGTTGGTGAVAQTGGSGTPGYGSFTLFPGNAGVSGIGNQSFGSITGVPTIAASSNSSSTGFQGFIDSLPGCGQRYKYISGNGYINSTPDPGPAIIYLTYYYI